MGHIEYALLAVCIVIEYVSEREEQCVSKRERYHEEAIMRERERKREDRDGR